MQVLQHEIDSLSRINDVGSFFDKCLIPRDILDKANAMAAAEGFSRHNASHLLEAGLPMDQLPNAGFRPTELKNFQPVQYYNYWKINSASVGFLYRCEFVKRNGFPIITKENIDTLVARVGETKPRPYFLTNGGDYKQQRKAKKLNQFIDGVFYETKAYDIGLDAFRDGEIQGDGFVHCFGRGGKLHKERVAGSELWVDEVEGQYGKPRGMTEIMLVDRDELAGYWPEHRQAIMDAPRAIYPRTPDAAKVFPIPATRRTRPRFA